MVYKYYPIVGISAGKGPDGEVPPRQEINAWSRNRKNRIQVVLFLKALKLLQEISPDKRGSYFQIAGINGMPYKSWDEPTINAKSYSHGGHLFLPWNRQYILLFEQRLYEIMVNEIIPKYPEENQSLLRTAADTWRMPYWDWSTKPQIPSLATQPELQISVLDELETISNPLYQFRMPNGKDMASEGVEDVHLSGEKAVLSYGSCIATSRRPSEHQRAFESTTWIHEAVNAAESNRYLAQPKSINEKIYGTGTEAVYRLLTYPLDYHQFSTMASNNSDAQAWTSPSIESINNNIHWLVGGEGGHMSQPAVAAFDPIFWLHYCNIDRLWAIYQELNPDRSLEGCSEHKEPLQPFHKDEQGTIWMAHDTRDFRGLGYTYPELQPLLSQYQPGGVFNMDLYTASILRQINLKYGVSRYEALLLLEGAINGIGNPLPQGIRKMDEGVALNDVALSIRYSKFALGGYPFNIEIFLEPAEGSGRQFVPDEYVANVYNYSSPAVGNDGVSCTDYTPLKRQDLEVAAYIPLNSVLTRLLKDGRLKKLDMSDVEDVLKNLYWRVTMGGFPVPEPECGQLNLQILMLIGEMSHSKDSNIPSKLNGVSEVLLSLGQDEPEKPQEPPDDPLLTLGPPKKLASNVTPGTSIVIESSSLNLSKPGSRDLNRIIFIYFNDSTGTIGSDNFDVVISVNIIRRFSKIQLQTKQATHGWEALSMINFPAWFQISSDLRIRVDARGGTYELYMNDNHIQSVPNKYGAGGITHVKYEASREPFAMLEELRIVTNSG
ncbi:uncharacterized protein BDW43DRAFT_302840 [Aspergillus alliaceus]|uniref:uncharacterized protein n=1 Tax=Petromyces alliaceus TaxID=209559 RepID=UPI0012A59C27|nr:uncharacterized protein BDW43DRAFT_302840 [Aspergillus alliaceus]KAB8229895.1 hypothetical protein BDW43DRAFT_302840 [Aspergillus alliaceus]